MSAAHQPRKNIGSRHNRVFTLMDCNSLLEGFLAALVNAGLKFTEAWQAHVHGVTGLHGHTHCQHLLSGGVGVRGSSTVVKVGAQVTC